ncbi:outer membrane protein assembly factor [Vibrio lamellibrachiae]|uniref:BamA/TamA family outer membrane protein n=1 Tax=Vibrio lamellibrachiae TaxID=2910253 RepID=UPI003D111AF9
MTHLLRVAALTCCLSSPAFAVKPLFETTPSETTKKLDDILAIFGAEEEYDPNKGIDSSYIPALFYTPEQGFGVGLLYVGLYGDTHGGTTQPSSMVINPYISTNGSKGITFENRHFFSGDHHRFYLDLELFDDAGVYYGVGHDAGSVNDNKINYSEKVALIEPTLLTKVADDFYLGLGANITYAKASDFELDDGQGSLDKSADLEENTSYGAKVSAVYDSRDNVLNASEGLLVDMTAGYFHSSLTNDWFGKYNFELANYITLGEFPGLIAWQVQGDFTSGDVPWNRLPDIGGANGLRGHVEGRYRDNHMAMGQVEYRLPIFWRVGAVFWGGVGSVAPEINELNEDLLTSVGAGLRFKIKDKVNIRADIGFGNDETAFYFHVNEVF